MRVVPTPPIRLGGGTLVHNPVPKDSPPLPFQTRGIHLFVLFSSDTTRHHLVHRETGVTTETFCGLKEASSDVHGYASAGNVDRFCEKCMRRAFPLDHEMLVLD